ATRPESLVVATVSPVDAGHAPVAETAAERFVFAQMYETLIDVDCEAHPSAALAASWSVDRTTGRATITLRPGAHFWDGQPLGARDVVAAGRAPAESPAAASLLARQFAEAAVVVDEHTLIVPVDDADPRVLAQPGLAVYRRRAGSLWPDGSGRYRAEDAPAA